MTECVTGTTCDPRDADNPLQKEVLWLRHRLQKGLITRDSEPKEEEMKGMAEYISKLETFPDLEPSIIRATKIHKVLKAILKLERIPKEEEFNFKSRSQVLWDKWTKILTADSASTSGAADDGAAAPANEEEKETAVNDVNGEKAAVAEEAAEEGEQGDKGVEKADGGKTNGVKEHVEEGDVAAPAEKKSEDADGEPSTQKVKTEVSSPLWPTWSSSCNRESHLLTRALVDRSLKEIWETHSTLQDRSGPAVCPGSGWEKRAHFSCSS